MKARFGDRLKLMAVFGKFTGTAMPKALKSTSPIFYSLVVWLVSALTGPCLLYWYFQWKGEELFRGNFVDWYSVFMPIGLVASSPSLLIFIWCVSLVNRRAWKLSFKKPTVVVGALLILAFNILLFAWWTGMRSGELLLFLFLPYALPLVVAVMILRFPMRVKEYPESN